MDRDDKQSAMERFYDLMESNTLGIKIFTYGLASIGLFTAMYKIKPITKFRKPSDIPYHFIQKRIPLKGLVTQVEMNNGPTVCVDYQPLISIPQFRKQTYLPLKIEGVDINMNGFSWLQTIVVGRDLTFIPINKDKNAVSCILKLPQKNKEPLDIGEELVKLGFATTNDIDSKLLKDKANINYKKLLETAQKRAKRKRNGVWHFQIPPTLLWKIQNYFSYQLNSILPNFITKRLNL